MVGTARCGIRAPLPATIPISPIPHFNCHHFRSTHSADSTNNTIRK
jgi:hypothetical protein